MTIVQKTKLVDGVREEFGTSAALRVLSLSRSTYYYQSGRQSYEEKYANLRKPLEAVARAHPGFGYRRATTELVERRKGQLTNRKVVQRLHRSWDLSLVRAVKPPRPGGVREAILSAGDRANLVKDLERIGPLKVVYTDFTELEYGGGKAWLIPILDHVTKDVLGWVVDELRTAAVAMRAWRKARRRLRRLGRSPRGMIVHHDQDPAFISYDWVREIVIRSGARLSYALEGAKDNPEMESFFGRFKVENRSLLMDAQTIAELRAVVARRMRYYRERRRHSSLGNEAPMRYLKRVIKRK
jgi:putative transposase